MLELKIALISALVTMVVNYTTNKINSRIATKDRTYEAKVFLRLKYEEFGLILSEAIKYVDQTLSNPQLSEHPHFVEKFNKLNVLSKLYFNKIHKCTMDLSDASVKLDDCITSHYTFTNAVCADDQLIDNEEYKEIEANYIKCKDILTKKYAKESPNYTFVSITPN